VASRAASVFCSSATKKQAFEVDRPWKAAPLAVALRNQAWLGGMLTNLETMPRPASIAQAILSGWNSVWRHRHAPSKKEAAVLRRELDVCKK